MNTMTLFRLYIKIAIRTFKLNVHSAQSHRQPPAMKKKNKKRKSY